MRRALATAAPFAVFLLLASVTWGRWIDPYVDAGRELMVPSRLAHGEKLYRDVRFYYGPLAPWIAAGVEATGGPSLPKRVALAGAIALLHIEALRRLAARLASTGQAALLTSLAVAVAFFLPPGGCHLFPYSLDSAIAVAAVTWALVLASGTSPTRSRDGRLAAAGVCVFAALLARPEYGVAAAVVLSLGKREGRERGRLSRLALLPAAAAGAVYAFASFDTPLHILRTEGWLTVLFAPPEFRNVYASFAGFDRPALRLAELALAAIVLALVGAFLLACAFFAARRFPRSGEARRAVPASAFVLVFATAALAVVSLVAFSPPASLTATLDLIPPLVRVAPPLLLVLGLARAAERLLGRTIVPSLAAIPDAVLWLTALFSARILLAAGYVGPYPAFFLPSIVVVSGAALFRFAAKGDRSLDAGRSSDPASSPATSLVALVASALVVFLAFRVADRARAFHAGAWGKVETPAGSVTLREPVASTTDAALRALGKIVAPGRPVAGFPEPGFFQYVLGHPNPLAADQFFPGHLDAAAERETIGRLTSRPPDAVVLANVLTVGHGPVAFGRDYLAELGRCVDEDFPVLVSFGPGARPEARIGDPDFFVEIRVPKSRIAR